MKLGGMAASPADSGGKTVAIIASEGDHRFRRPGMVGMDKIEVSSGRNGTENLTRNRPLFHGVPAHVRDNQAFPVRKSDDITLEPAQARVIAILKPALEQKLQAQADSNRKSTRLNSSH